jgi:MFS family permease
MATPGHPGTDPRDESVGELLKQLSRETSTLVRQELDLAKAELSQKGKRAGVGAGLIGGAGVIGLLAGGALTACFIALLDLAMTTWLAALIVAVVYGAIAGVLALQGRDKVQDAAPAVPEQTVETLKEDAEWARNRKRSAAT